VGLANRDKTPRVWVVSELYYPEETSTGYILTKIAEGLASGRSVGVITSQPNHSARGARVPRHEVRSAVAVFRGWSTKLNRHVLMYRMLNSATVTCSLCLGALARIHAGDVVIVVTNPPLLPLLLAPVCRLRGARLLVLVHDVYPDALVASGLIGARSLPVRLIGAANRALYRAAERVIVLGRDMRDLIAHRFPESASRIATIPNWGDVDHVKPDDSAGHRFRSGLGLNGRFVVQYAGNMGRTHDLESPLASAAALASASCDVHFLFAGSGAKRRWLDDAIRAANLPNVALLPPQPQSGLSALLNACDVALISFVPGMAGVSVPSRMYNIMAAGKPIIAVADQASELAQVVQEARIGWVVPPGDAEALTQAILHARSDRALLGEMGKRARAEAESKYTFAHVLSAYKQLLSELGCG